jgi:hypothetical protein
VARFKNEESPPDAFPGNANSRYSGGVLFGLLSCEKSDDLPAFRWIYSARVIANFHAPHQIRAEREGDLEMKKLLLASVCALALGGVSNADAQPWAVSVDGDYTHTQFNAGPGSHGNFDGYDVNGAVDLPWTWLGIGLELNGASHGLGFGHDTQGGGSLIWDGIPNFRLAGTVVYNWANYFLIKTPEWQTGAGAEWYVNPWLTVSLQGGGIEGRFSGGYVGGTIKGYICPDLSLAGYINYTSTTKNFGAGNVGGNETDYGVKGEWLFWQDTLPLSLTARYEHTHLNEVLIGPLHLSPDSFFVGLKLYLDEGGAPKPLVERNRTGTLDTIGPITPLSFRTLL